MFIEKFLPTKEIQNDISIAMNNFTTDRIKKIK